MATVDVEWAGSGKHVGTLNLQWKPCADKQYGKYSCTIIQNNPKPTNLLCDGTFPLCSFIFERSMQEDAKRCMWVRSIIFELLKTQDDTADIKVQKAVCLWLGHDAPVPLTTLCDTVTSISADVAEQQKRFWEQIDLESHIVLAVTLYSERELAIAALENTETTSVRWVFRVMLPSTRFDAQVIKFALNRSADCIEEVRDDDKTKDVMLLVCWWMNRMGYTPSTLQDDKYYFVQWASCNFGAVSCFPKKFRKDKDVCLAGLKNMMERGWSLKKFAVHEIAQHAIPRYYIDKDWFKDQTFMRKAVQANPFLLLIAPKCYATDPMRVFEAMKRLQPGVDNEAMEKHMIALVEAKQQNQAQEAQEAQTIREKPNVFSLKDACHLQHNALFVFLCVKVDGMQLEFAAQHLRQAQTIVTAATQQNPKACRFVKTPTDAQQKKYAKYKCMPEKFAKYYCNHKPSRLKILVEP